MLVEARRACSTKRVIIAAAKHPMKILNAAASIGYRLGSFEGEVFATAAAAAHCGRQVVHSVSRSILVCSLFRSAVGSSFIYIYIYVTEDSLIYGVFVLRV